MNTNPYTCPQPLLGAFKTKLQQVGVYVVAFLFAGLVLALPDALRQDSIALAEPYRYNLPEPMPEPMPIITADLRIPETAQDEEVNTLLVGDTPQPLPPVKAKTVVTTSQGGDVPAIWPLGFPIDLDVSKSIKGAGPDATKVIVKPEYIGSRVIRPADNMFIIGTGLDEVTVEVMVVTAYKDTLDVWEKKIRCVKDPLVPPTPDNPDPPKPKPTPDNPDDPDMKVEMIKSIVEGWRAFKPTPSTLDKSAALSVAKSFGEIASRVDRAIKNQQDGMTDPTVDMGYLLQDVIMQKLSLELKTVLGQDQYPQWLPFINTSVGKVLDSEEAANGRIKPARYSELLKQAQKAFEKVAK